MSLVGQFYIVGDILNFSDEEAARNFYIAIGIVIIVIGMLTDYQAEARDRQVK